MSLLTPPRTPERVKASSLQTPPRAVKPSAAQALSYPTAGGLFTPPATPDYKSALEASPYEAITPASTLQSRQLSDNELSYYLPSRGDGVNDMYLHHKLRAPHHLMSKDRMVALWAYQLVRHPLLASSIRFNSYEQVDFVHRPPTTVEAALAQAESRFSYATCSSEDILDNYLNGPRTLSNQNLGYLFVRSPDLEGGEYEIMLCATHFLGDGMALHTFMNEFYTLLGSAKSTLDIVDMTEDALPARAALPTPMEDKLPQPSSSLKQAVGADEYLRSEQKLVGGQGFPRNPKKMDRRTVVPTFAYTPEETKAILGACKRNGVTIAHAVFALCNLAWAKLTNDKVDPCLIYSALNMRAQMSSLAPESYFHLAVGYFNIVLPSHTPSSLSTSELFWHRARMTKSQTVQAVKSPFLVSRSLETSKIRKSRAVKWAKIDDQDAQVVQQKKVGLGLGVVMPEREAPAPLPQAPKEEKIVKGNDINTPTPQAVNQKALMGLSMLGNLDGMYKHSSFPDMQLTSLTTGSRQRQGALLLFAYTFAGKLWISLGYDVNGFQEGIIENFWEEVQRLVREVLL